MAAKRNLVYGTDTGRLCPGCGKPAKNCQCKTMAPPPRGDGIVRLQRQTKGRNGKPVVVISGLDLGADELKALARRLKAKCGVGGTVENFTIVIQGDKRAVLQAELEAMGHTVKSSGG